MKNTTKPCCGTGLGGYGKPTQGLGLEMLGLVFATMQMALDNGQNSILWHLGTEGYDVTQIEREALIGYMTQIASDMGKAMEKLPVLTNDGQRGSPHLARVFSGL